MYRNLGVEARLEACIYGSFNVFRSLINGEGTNWPAFSAAIQNGHFRILQLIQKEYIKSKNAQERARDEASRSGHLECMKILFSSRFIQNNPAINSTVYYICWRGYDHVLRWLLENGLDKNPMWRPNPPRPFDDQMPDCFQLFHLSVENGWQKIVRVFLEYSMPIRHHQVQ